MITYGSHDMIPHEVGYCITRKELLEIYYFILGRTMNSDRLSSDRSKFPSRKNHFRYVRSEREPLPYMAQIFLKAEATLLLLLFS